MIGEGMRGHVGVAGAMFSCLAEAQVNLEMISQGASEINMSVVVDEACRPSGEPLVR